jgi:hypothetical protein
MKIIITILMLILPLTVGAALDSKYQNSNDLDVIIGFINTHELVLSTLKSIDFKNKVVHYDKECEAKFGRKQIKRKSGWVGPASALEYLNSNCAIDY